MKQIAIFVIAIFMFSACAKSKLKRELKNFIGQEIIIPANLPLTLGGMDTVMTGFSNVPAKLVVLYDSVGCSSCEISRMYQWDDVTAFSKGTRNKFNVIFIFSPKQTRSGIHEVKTSLRASQFNYPVYVDTVGAFISANKNIPADRRFHTFLLGKDNKVVAAGSPQMNFAMWELYKAEIKKILDM